MSKEFKKRLITSIVLIVILLNCLFISNVSWLVLLTIVSLICWFEFINLSKKIWKKISVKVLMILISFLFLFFFFYAAYEIKIKIYIVLKIKEKYWQYRKDKRTYAS